MTRQSHTATQAKRLKEVCIKIENIASSIEATKRSNMTPGLFDSISHVSSEALEQQNHKLKQVINTYNQGLDSISQSVVKIIAQLETLI